MSRATCRVHWSSKLEGWGPRESLSAAWAVSLGWAFQQQYDQTSTPMGTGPGVRPRPESAASLGESRDTAAGHGQRPQGTGATCTCQMSLHKK